MPKANPRSQKAKSQNILGRHGFGSGVVDDDLALKSRDPDFVLTEESFDSDWEDNYRGAFALYVGPQPVECAEEEDCDGEAVNESDSDLDDAVIVDDTPSIKPRLLRALGTYSGTSRATMFKKKKQLADAAKGCQKIDAFFSPQVRNPASQANSNQSSSRVLPVGSITDQDVIMAESPVSHVDEDHELSHGTETMTDGTTKDANIVGEITARTEEEIIPVEELLNILVDDEMESPMMGARPDIESLVDSLLKDARKHHSYCATFKLQAIKDFLHLRKKFSANPKVKNPYTRAAFAVAKGIGKGPYFARHVAHLTRYIECFRALPPSGSGKHHAHPSILNDERVAQAVRRYLTVVPLGEITPAKLCDQVNNTIIPKLGLNLGKGSISEQCARRWLHKLGYAVRRVWKGVYVDGHERKDVVEAREKFLAKVKECEHLRYQYNDENLEPIAPTLQPGEKLHVPIFQDESIFRSNDLRNVVWAQDGKLPLRKKGQGRSIHVSDFILEYTGRLRLSDEQIKEQELRPIEERLIPDAHEIIYPGKNNDGWWNGQRLISQVRKTIPLFEKLYPGAVGEFFFDQSTAHGAYSEDALNVNKMNVNPGGKNAPRMHATWIPSDNPNPALRGQVQTLVFASDLPPDHPDFLHAGKPKGMKRILEERGLLEELARLNGGKPIPGDCSDCKRSRKERERLEQEEALTMAGQDENEETTEDIHHPDTRVTCCMRKVLGSQADFQSEKPYLQIMIKEAGHKCYFLPKFHCELNPIEMYWGWVKIRYRSLGDGSFGLAKTLVPELLDACEVKTIRAFFRKSWRYMDAYENGLNAQQAEYAVRKFRSHRRIGSRIMMSVNMLVN